MKHWHKGTYTWNEIASNIGISGAFAAQQAYIVITRTIHKYNDLDICYDRSIGIVKNKDAEFMMSDIVKNRDNVQRCQACSRLIPIHNIRRTCSKECSIINFRNHIKTYQREHQQNKLIEELNAIERGIARNE